MHCNARCRGMIFPHIFCEERRGSLFKCSLLTIYSPTSENIMDLNIQQNYDGFDGDSDSDYSMIGDEEESHSWQSESNMSVSEETKCLETSKLMDTPRRLISSGRHD